MLTFSPKAQANYQQGMAHFQRGDFVTSAALFYQAQTLFRDQAERRMAEWYLAESLNRLGLYYSASKYYSIIVRRGYNSANPLFRNALDELGKINSSISLGQAHIVQLFRTRIDPAVVPGQARGFYFYYLGVEQFTRGQYARARDYFRNVPSSSPYALGANFHMGVIANLAGQHSTALDHFSRVRQVAIRQGRSSYMYELATMNMARVYYETRRFNQAVTLYGEILRGHDNYWLEAHWEGAWAHFMRQAHNNTLGNIHTIHSPFFRNRFYPESYILQSITFLRLCRYDEVRRSLLGFRNRYQGVFQEVRSMISQYERDPQGFFRLVFDYRTGTLNRYRRAFEILDRVSRTDWYREASDTIRFSTREMNRLASYRSRWAASGLLNELQGFLQSKSNAAAVDAGRRLFQEAVTYYQYLGELSEQSGLIQAEMQLGKINELRAQLQVGTAPDRQTFIGGMQALEVGQTLEYWPFQPNEYWEDELGYYLYNIDSRCEAQQRPSRGGGR